MAPDGIIGYSVRQGAGFCSAEGVAHDASRDGEDLCWHQLVNLFGIGTPTRVTAFWQRASV